MSLSITFVTNRVTMKLLLRQCVLLLAVACCHGMFRVQAPAPAPTPPFFPTNASYHAKGLIRIPYAEIEEPFEVYYDAPNKRSRIDYYNSTVATYQLPMVNKFGVSRKVVYETTDTKYNVRSCFEVNGTANATIDIQTVLPNISADFKYVGQKIFLNDLCDVWEMVQTITKKVNTYRIWMTVATPKKPSRPARFEMIGYNVLLGSHYDKYDVIYSSYDTKCNMTDEIFQIGKDVVPCTGFPGPGVQAEHVISSNPMREFIHGEDNHVHVLFEQHKEKHRKNYDDDKEHESRKNNFRHNLRYINSKNRAGLSYSLGLNHMADWSDHEFRSLRGRLPSLGAEEAETYGRENYNPADLPDFLDWRLYGAVTPVKDQAICGSCWSFGTTGTIEGAYFVKTAKLARLSQQALIDCSWGYQNNGCDGGEDFRAYRWILKNGGIPLADAYGPYKGIDDKCRIKDIKAEDKVQIKSYVNVSSVHDLPALQAAIYYQGPISVGIDASQKSFSFYANGIYYDENCSNKEEGLDHSVLAVGFGIMDGQPYWLIKNSWSTHWGNDGYVLMSQKDNNCGVATSPSFVIM